MTNGQPLLVRAAIKPISTLTKPLRSVDTETKEPAEALRERTDSTVVPAAAVVGEAMVCLTLAACYREKFGGDHIDDVLAAVEAYKQRIDWRGRPAEQRPALVFIGFMGAGKSTALAVAREHGLETTEIDELMEREFGMPIAEAFERARRGGVPPPRGGDRRRAAGGGRRRGDRARRRQHPLRAGA